MRLSNGFISISINGFAVALLLSLLCPVAVCRAEETPPASDASTEPFAATAAEEEGPEHGKINTPDPSVVDPGHFEIEASYLYANAKHSWNGNGNVFSHGAAQTDQAGLLITAGALENLDFSVFGRTGWLKDKENGGLENGSGIGDASFNGRYRFLEDKELNLEAAYIGGFTAPAGNHLDFNASGIDQDFWSWDQTLVATKDWGAWTANADVGFSLPFGEHLEGTRGIANADLAGGYQVLSWLQPELELNYAHTFMAGAGDQDVVATTIGLVMPIDERLRIDTGVQQGLWGRNADRMTSLYIAAKTAF
jgi:hypothetical protein